MDQQNHEPSYSHSDYIKAQIEKYCKAKAFFEALKPLPIIFFVVPIIVLMVIAIIVFFSTASAFATLFWFITVSVLVLAVIAIVNIRINERINALAKVLQASYKGLL